MDNAVGKIQGVDGLGFVAEPAQRFLVVGELVPEHLDGHPAVLHRVDALVDLIEDLIGVGGMANVYKGIDTVEDRWVAVKSRASPGSRRHWV